MNRIDQKFIELRRAKKKAFIAFVTAGDPGLKATEELVLALERTGVDIIELGVPFSDPLADGPVIQAASYRSLKRGTTLARILELVKRIRRVCAVPIALMSYYNPVFHFGEKAFVAEAGAAGVDGVIIPDLPVDEADELCRCARRAGLATVFFMAPTTSKERMKKAAEASTGFIYYVSVAGVTGGRQGLAPDVLAKVRLAKTLTRKPVCVGFGVSTPGQARALAAVADGVIVGSAIVKEIARHAGKKDLAARVGAFVRPLIKAVK